MHQHVLMPPEVTDKFADVSLKTFDAGYLAQQLALRPANIGQFQRGTADRCRIRFDGQPIIPMIINQNDRPIATLAGITRSFQRGRYGSDRSRAVNGSI
jgi:hypothetical protein